MKGIFVTLYDAKADTYTPPVVADSNAAAIRQLSLLVNADKGSLVELHPEDFTLFRIGSFDGACISSEERQALANGIDVKVVRSSVQEA